MEPAGSSHKHLWLTSVDVRPGVSPLLKLTTALLAGGAFLAASGQARAGYVASLGLDASSAMGSAAVAEPSWTETDLPVQPPADEPPARDRHAGDWLARLLQPQLLGSTPQSGGMGGTGGPQTGGSSPPIGLTSTVPFVFVQTRGRLFLVYVCHRPPPFRSRLFHPPRAPAT
jgi:hypothetical protein